MIKMKAAVIHHPDDPFTIEEVELEEPKGDEVLVKISASGLCRTDDFGRTLNLPMPMVLGHEGAGIVEKVGNEVTEFKPGDHVIFSFASCGHCHNCITGRPAYCENFNAINFGGTAADGTTRIYQNGKPVTMFFGQSSFAEYATVSARSTVKVDQDVDLGMFAPLGCGLQTGSGAVLNTLMPQCDETIAIFGCGAVGISAVMAAHAVGMKQIIVVDMNQPSLDFAKELGATDAVNTKELPEGFSIADAVKELSNGGVNYTLDTSGYGPMIHNAIKSTCTSGKTVLVSPSGVIEHFEIGKDVLGSYRTIIGCCEGDSNPKVFIPRLIQLYKTGRFPLEKIVTTYPFEEINRARDDFNAHKVMKAVVRIGIN